MAVSMQPNAAGGSDGARVPMLSHVTEHALSTQSVARNEVPVMGVSEPPSSGFIFKMMMKKNLYLGLKRGRIISAVIPLAIQCTVSVVLFRLFSNMGSPSMSGILVAAIVPLNLMFGINSAFQGAYLDIIGEKENKMKIMQNVYGLSTTLYWSTWFAYYSLVSVFCMVVIYLLFTLVAPVLNHVNFLISFLIIACAFAQQFILCCVLCVFFDSVKTASAVSAFATWILMAASAGIQFIQGGGILFYLVGLLPVANVFSSLSSMLWLVAAKKCDATGHCESPGATLNDLFTGHVCLIDYSDANPCKFSRDFFPVGLALLMMIIDVVLLWMLAWWLDNVWQGEYGSAKPKFFCFDPHYMCPRRHDSVAPLESEGRQVALSIRSLRKEFAEGKVAVDNMSLEMYSNEIFALLGHNGAGKTTAMNCVVGLIPPTSGEATVNGFDVGTSLDCARQQMAYCPQDNPMYNEFTMRQHLRFFSSLRGVSEEHVDARMNAVLQALGMTEKIDDLCSSLSGGQKRRLWVATALIGEAPVSFLDEPTSGMDPSARRELWDYLLQIKAAGRCVIFTTHYLEEADVLADRKAVLARGQVRAVGTSRDLKLEFGTGYKLRFELKHDAPADSHETLLNFISGHVATAAHLKEAEEERMQAHDAVRHVTFTLPYAEVDNFGPLLTALDSEKAVMQVDDYTISMTSLEDVFMKLGRDAEQEAAAHGDVGVNEDFTELSADAAAEQFRSEASPWRSTKAIYRSRLIPLKTNKRRAFFLIWLPVVFIVMSFVISGTGSNDESASEGNSYAIIIYPAMGFGMTLVAMCLDLITDRTQKCKYVAMSQGLSPRCYWAGTVAAHLTTMVPSILVFIIMLLVQRPQEISGNFLPLLLMMICIYPLNMLLCGYNISCMFETPEFGQKVIPMLTMLGGMIPSMLVWVFLSPIIHLGTSTPQEGPSEMWSNIALAVHVVMSVVNPMYPVPGMLACLVTKYAFKDVSFLHTLTSWAAFPLYLSPVCFLLFMGNLIRLDSKSYSAAAGSAAEYGDAGKDEEVKAEEGRCEEEDATGEAARYHGLCHTYRTKVGGRWKETPAVRGISLGIRKGECFGLLGPNGAGKTTTLGVLTGEIRPPTSGNVSIFGHDMSSNEELRKAYEVLGICPQVDPLWPDISGREHLNFYGRIKGVPETSLENTVNALLHRLGLNQFDANKPSSTYSGGMKRKLSLGIALIGHSQMLFLDEPSAAVDAGAKRHLWKVIKLRGPDQTVVLTTHSMEEAEALCDRIAIQVKGQLRCLGTPMHIKRKYGSGYQLELLVKPKAGTSFGSNRSAANVEAFTAFVRERISDTAELLESHAGRLLYQLPQVGSSGGSTLGHMFTELHRSKEEMCIVDYSIMQPSLEQVFLRFAREQEETEPVHVPPGDELPV